MRAPSKLISSYQCKFGIPSVEDKIIQMGIKRILEAIWEVDFVDVSFGFRPKRSCQQCRHSIAEA